MRYLLVFVLRLLLVATLMPQSEKTDIEIAQDTAARIARQNSWSGESRCVRAALCSRVQGPVSRPEEVNTVYSESLSSRPVNPVSTVSL